MSHDQNSAPWQAGTAAALLDLGLAGHVKQAGILSSIAGLAGKPFAWAGNKALGGLAHAGASPATLGTLGSWGKGLATEMGGMGLFSGGIEAVMAEPQDRAKSFARGFGTGSVQGLGWGLGSRAVSKALGRALPPRRFEQLEKTKLWGKGAPAMGERAKALGAKALPMAGAFVASDIAGAPFGQSMLVNKQPPNRSIGTYPQTYGPMLGVQPNDPYGAPGPTY